MKTTLENPMRYFDGNLALSKSGDVWAYYHIPSESISNHDIKKKEEFKDNKLAFLFKDLAKFGEISLNMIPKELDLDERFFGETSLSNDFASDVFDVAEYYAKKQISQLKNEFGIITQSYYVLGVKLKSFRFDDTLRSSVKNTFEDATRQIMPLFGYEVAVDKKFFDSFAEPAKDVEAVLSGLKAVPLTTDELTYFIRHDYIRGQQHNVIEESEEHYLPNISDATLSGFNRGVLEIKTDIGTSYAKFMPISETPEDLTNSHFFEVAQQLRFSVEFKIKAMTEKKKGFAGSLTAKVSGLDREFNSEEKDAYKAGQNTSNSDKRRVKKFLLKNLQNGIEKENEYFKWLGVFVVYGSSVKEVQKNARILQNNLRRRKIKLSSASAQQIDLFYRLLPNYSLEGETRWLQYSSHQGLAENLYGISHQLGNSTGYVIGRVSNLSHSQNIIKSIYSSRDLVLFNPLVSNQGISGSATSSPHIPVTGQTGRGKSFLVKLIMLYLSMMNAKLLYIDPKQEIKRWFNRATQNTEFQNKYPYLMKLIKQYHFTTLDQANSQNWGILDPIVFLAGSGEMGATASTDTDPAYEVALAMFEQVFNLPNPYVKAELSEAIKHTIADKWQGKRVGMLDVLDYLSNSQSEESKKASDAIRSTVSGGILKLSFSHGENDAVSFNTRINILEVAGLDLPDETTDASSYTDIQRKSLATMFALGKFADRFGRENPDEYTFEIIDEAWIFQVSSVGRSILKSIKRVGRSFNNALVYATQSIDDISSEDDHGQFGVIFAFNEPSETKKILDFVGLEPTAKNVEWFENFIKGEALMRDVYGRVGKIAVHSMFPEFTELFKTLEKSESAKAEEMFS